MGEQHQNQDDLDEAQEVLDYLSNFEKFQTETLVPADRLTEPDEGYADWIYILSRSKNEVVVRNLGLFPTKRGQAEGADIRLVLRRDNERGTEYFDLDYHATVYPSEAIKVRRRDAENSE